MKKTFMVNGSESVDTTCWLASEIEKTLFFVRSHLKKRVVAAIFIKTMIIR